MKETLKLALEALEASHFLIHGNKTKGGLAFCMDGYYSGCFDIDSNDKQTKEAIIAIKKALAQPAVAEQHKQEPRTADEKLARMKSELAYMRQAQPEQEKERCVGCEACIDTACGRDECPKGWPKALQPEQKPVAWRAPNWGHGDDEWVYRDFDDPVLIAHGRPSPNNEPLYTTPPQRTWVGLTDEDLANCDDTELKQALYWEQILKEKNT